MKKNLLIVLIICVVYGCSNFGSKPKKNIVQDTTINLQTSFNNLFFDSLQLANFITSDSLVENYRSQFFDFYKDRNYEYAWFDTNGLVEPAHNFYNLQNSYISAYNDSSLYNHSLEKLFSNITNFTKASAIPQKDALALELLLTSQFFKYASKVYQGSDIDAAELGWFIPRKKINITATLDSVLQTKNKEQNTYEPLNAQYRQLEKYLIRYNQLLQKESWQTIAFEKLLKKGDSSKSVPMIKQRLFVLGDLSRADSSLQFDSTLWKAVKQFQKRMGLPTSGSIGVATLKEMNKPLDSLIKKLLVNMERSRWILPDTGTTDKLIVNIPEYKLHVYDSGKYSFSMNVVVGTAANSTVIFNGAIQSIVFSPYWNVTEDITKKEILPALKKDPNYLQKHQMEIVKHNGKIPVIRQKPGPENALGGVKFLFPNSYNIYLHDTPNKDVFSANKRSFSHGCIRLGEPAKLAQFLLRRDTSYTADSIQTLMHLGKEKWLAAKPKVPVTIKYFTAWVDEKGLLHFRDDIYGHDAKMAEKLFTK
ncbi:MAG: L,D-transpeptidase family protein [Chitinophagaceae bacterium]